VGPKDHRRGACFKGITRGAFPEIEGRRKTVPVFDGEGKVDGKIEAYDFKRFFTTTGLSLVGKVTLDVDATEQLAEFTNQFLLPKQKKQDKPKKQPTTSNPMADAFAEASAGTPMTIEGKLSDAEILQKAFAAKNAKKFKALWEGDTSGYGSPSEADAALALMLAFWSGKDAVQMERLLRQSKLMRDKWDEPRGDRTLIQVTIDNAIAFCTEVRSPSKKGDGNGQYRHQGGRTIRTVIVKEEAVDVVLGDFTAKIVAETIQDDGVERIRVYTLAIELPNGTSTTIEVAATKFHAMEWIGELPVKAIIRVGAKDHIRCATQMLSPEVPPRVSYTHTGWRFLDGQSVYLHAGGAIGKDGVVPDLKADLTAPLNRINLPAPPTGSDLTEAVQAVLRLFNVGPHKLTFPGIIAAFRAIIGPADYVVNYVGQTGTFKSAFTALFQSFFGAEFDGRTFMAGWNSTGNALTAIAFSAKNALLVADDFCPASAGNQSQVAAYHAQADRVIRTMGNHQGRQRCRPDGTIQREKNPRCVLMMSGEDEPRGQSCKARLVTQEVRVGDIDRGRLTEAQRLARQGVYAAAMAGFIQWIAPQIDNTRRDWTALVEGRRAVLTLDADHGRILTAAADLSVTLDLFLGFACVTDAISVDQVFKMQTAFNNAIGETSRKQDIAQAESDPCRRFLDLLIGALESGRAHVAHKHGTEPQTLRTAWGWELVGGGEKSFWRPKGKKIGWVDDEDLYLSPESAYAMACEMAQQQGEAFTTSAKVLKRFLNDKHYLVNDGGAREVYTARVVIEKVRKEVLHLRAAQLVAEKDPEQ
jgi:hypothetical protein